MPVPPAPLPENAGVAFRGEPAWAPAQLSERQAKQLLSAANACGRPNADVLRRRLAVRDGAPTQGWQIDFPSHFTNQECALYEHPFARLANAGPNPHTRLDLRRALARLSRYLAMPADADVPDWIWVEDELLPDASLVVVAREDDFTHGVLSSKAFAAWYAAHRSATPADGIVASYPFPWSPSTTLNALTATQEESRHAIARAIRSGNLDQLNAAVARAYGWSADLGEDFLLASLMKVHNSRRHSPSPSS